MKSRRFVAPSEIERETGFGKEQLRKWRQRFAFPPNELTADGKPVYSHETISQLLLIKRLLEGGFRPSQVVGKTALELEELLRALGESVSVVCRDESTQAFIEHLKQADLVGFAALLEKKREQQTLLGFLTNTVGPLLVSVGDAWVRNEIDMYHEHLCTGYIERYLHGQILALQPKQGSPNILFALPPGENHAVGLLMTEAVLAEHGARTISIGSNIPLNNLKLAAISYDADVVAVSFSFAYPARDVIPTLKHLRRFLPSRIQIWAGGAGISGVKRPINGVRIFSNFGQAIVAFDELTA